MGSKKRKHAIQFGELGLNFEEPAVLIESGPKPIEVESAYSVSIDQDEEGTPLIRVKTYGDVNMNELKQTIKEKFPKARIREMEVAPVVEIIKKPSRKKRKVKRPAQKKRKKKKSSKKTKKL